MALQLDRYTDAIRCTLCKDRVSGEDYRKHMVGFPAWKWVGHWETKHKQGHCKPMPHIQQLILPLSYRKTFIQRCVERMAKVVSSGKK